MAVRPSCTVARGDPKFTPQVLQEGKLAGAYLDVFSTEPLGSDSPLWSLQNVILSPHDSASCIDNAGRVQSIFASNLRQFAAGKDLQNVVWGTLNENSSSAGGVVQRVVSKL